MPVRTERRDNVLTVIHSRAGVRNAVDPEHAQALHDAFVAFDADEAAHVAVFWGEGGAFCAGADLKALATRGIATRDNAQTHTSLEYPRDGGAVPRGPMGPSRLILSKARQAAEDMAQQIARFPQAAMRADRRSLYLTHGLADHAALEREWYNCTGVFKAEGAAGVAQFAKGAGRHGDFANHTPPHD